MVVVAAMFLGGGRFGAQLRQCEQALSLSLSHSKKRREQGRVGVGEGMGGQ